jgi:hypothetical protein
MAPALAQPWYKFRPPHELPTFLESLGNQTPSPPWARHLLGQESSLPQEGPPPSP